MSETIHIAMHADTYKGGLYWVEASRDRLTLLRRFLTDNGMCDVTDDGDEKELDWEKMTLEEIEAWIEKYNANDGGDAIYLWEAELD